MYFFFSNDDKKLTSNTYFSTIEESESCLVQPKPCILGKESTLYGQVQKGSLPPLEKLKISAVSTANGVKSLHEQPLAKDAADPPGSTEETQPLEGLMESEPPQPDGKDDTPEAGGTKKDVEAVTEAQLFKGNAETEPLGAEAKGQPLRTAGEITSLGAVGGTEKPQAAGEMKPLERAEKIPPLEAAREPQSQEVVGKDGQSQLPDPVPKETASPEILEGSQLVETAAKQQVQETLGEDEQSQLVETIPKDKESLDVLDRSQLVGAEQEQQLQETLETDEQPQLLEMTPRENGTLGVSDGSQLVETAVKDDLLHTTPESPGNMEQIPPGRAVGSMEHPAGSPETGAEVEMVRKIHTNKEDQHIEGKSYAVKDSGCQMCFVRSSLGGGDGWWLTPGISISSG